MMYALEFVNGWNDGQDSSPCSAEIILSRPHIQALDFSAHLDYPRRMGP